MADQSVSGWVAPTHRDWFAFLSRQRRWREVNFWRPSDTHGFHGQPGAPFFFKLTAPHSKIAGFGFVAKFSRLPEWLAWECFGEANGAPSLEVLRARLESIRKRSALKGTSTLKQIGCIVLVDAVFFPEQDWIAQPIVQP